MTMSESIEQRLVRIFDRPVPDHLRRQINERLTAVQAETTASTGRSGWRSLRRATVLALAAAITLAAAAIGFELFGQILFQPGWKVAWERSTEIGQQAVIGGETVRLERGYADATQVLIGWTTTAADPAALTHDDHGPISLTDAAGRPYLMNAGSGTDTVDGTVNVMTFLPLEALTASENEFTLQFPDGVSFAFSLPVTAGTVASLDGAATAADFTLHVSEFRATPTGLGVYLSIDALPGAPVGETWVVIGHLEHDGQSFPISWVQDLEDGRQLASVVSGIEDAAGRWTLTVDELVGHNGAWPDNQQIRVSGPWVIEFEVD